MCNPTTQHPISEALPLVNALIAEAERNCIDINSVDVYAYTGGRFAIDIIAYDGGGQALAGLLNLHPTFIFTSLGKSFQAVSRTDGCFVIGSHYPLPDAEEAAA